MLIISLLVAGLIRLSFFDFLQPFAREAHLTCLQHLPSQANSLPELKALVCAENFSTLADSHLYISGGLIHLFVVSGAHLILIEKLLARMNFPPVLTLPVLVVYGFACSLNPPVARSLFSFALGFYLSGQNIHWPGHFKILVSGLFALLFNWHWITSLSLQMSWIAAFLVMAGSSFFKTRSALFKQSLFFWGLFPSVVFFQVPGPSVILVNLLLAPVLEFVLFPLGLVVLFFNPVWPLFDRLISVFQLILQKLELNLNFQLYDRPSPLTFFNWGLILLLHLISHLLYVQKNRRSRSCGS